jgi:carboxyl-terminal processing protease
MEQFQDKNLDKIPDTEVKRGGIGSAGIFIIIAASFFLGSYVGEHQATGAETKTPDVDMELVSEEEFAPFWKVWKIIDEKHVSASSTDSQERVWGAIQGLARSQGDPYTVFFPPEDDKSFRDDISGNFEGVGMEIGIRDNALTVVSPIKGSPAERAGVRTGDKILKIGDKSAIGLSVDEAVKLIRGPKGTDITITFVIVDSDEPVERTITRDVIVLPTVETELRSDGIFVIRLWSFTENSPNLFRNALREFVKSGSNKLIFDLRSNPGGYLEAAWDISSWFLPIGKIVVTEDFGGKQENRIYRSKGYNVIPKSTKIVILVDGGSASASEIVAGALRENGVGKLVGTTTFGKGSVQELIRITEDTSLKVTVARWLTPEGHNLSEGGLTPDFEVKITKEDIEAEKDPQMDKAVEILNK